MPEPWAILTRRYGGETTSPTFAQLKEAMAELYHETLLRLAEGDYSEHGSASLRFGNDTGPMYLLEVNRLRQMRFEEWADQDYERELAPPRTMQSVPQDMALRLWS